MSSIICPNCNSANWVQAVACKRCGFEFADSGSSAPRPRTQPLSSDGRPAGGFVSTGQRSDPYHPYANMGQSTLKSGLALASMIIGIAAIPTSLFLIGLLLVPVGIVTGIVALVRASKEPFIYGGKGFAIAGITTSCAALVFVFPLIAAIAIPNLLASKRAADEASAIARLRTLFSAEATYRATAGAGKCGDLNALAKNSLIDPAIANSLKNDFRFEVVVSGGGRVCEIFATPVSKLGGARSFMVAEDGVIRGAVKKGVMADKHDPPIAN